MPTKLKRINATLNENGFFTRFVPAGNEQSHEQLFLIAGRDPDGRETTMEMFFVPDTKDLDVLQMFIPTPREKPIALEAASRFLLPLNEKLPLGYFGLNESRNWLYFRCQLACEEEQLPEELVLRTVRVILYLLERFGPCVRAVADGEWDFNQAREELKKILNFKKTY